MFQTHQHYISVGLRSRWAPTFWKKYPIMGDPNNKSIRLPNGRRKVFFMWFRPLEDWSNRAPSGFCWRLTDARKAEC